jgi:hypothetical protein
MELSLHIFFNEHELVLIVDGQKNFSRDNNGVLRENTLTYSKICIKEGGGVESNKENSSQGIETSPEETMKKRR